MLEPPAISESLLRGCLEREYALHVAALEFLPLGADLATAVYRARTINSDYFVKLRFGPFDDLSARLPRLLVEQGIEHILAPQLSRTGAPFAATPEFTLLVYPFVEGHDAYEGVLTDTQWAAFGRVMRQVHRADLPDTLDRRLPRERFDARWRNDLRAALEALDVHAHVEPVARRFAAFMAEQRARVLDILARTQQLAGALQADDLPFVLCHTDLHPGNLLVRPDGQFYIVDWDAPLLAPAERDLMYAGGAQGFPGRTPEQEEAQFFAGYGRTQVDLRAVAYYRLERVIEDLAIFCGQLLDPEAGSAADRQQAFGWATSNFLPGHTIEIAERTEQQARVHARMTYG